MTSKTSYQSGGQDAEQAGDLLTLIHGATTAIQKATTSDQNILNVIQARIAAMGLRGGLSILDETGEYLVFKIMAYPTSFQKIIDRLERLTVFKSDGYSIRFREIEVYRNVITTGKTVFVPDSSVVVLALIPRTVRVISQFIRSVFGKIPAIYVPLITEGEVFGVLNIVGKNLSETDIPGMEIFASHISVALENTRLIAEQRVKDEQNRRLLKHLPLGFFRSKPDGEISEINPAILEILGYPDNDALLKKNAGDFYADPKDRDRMLEIITRRGVLNGFETRFRKSDGAEIWVRMTAQPIFNEEGELILIEGVMNDITAQKRDQDKLLYDAFHDALTDLSNRELFTDHLRLAIDRAKRESDYHYAVLFLDLDHFKVVNDSLGHLIGDRLLFAMGQRLKECVRAVDTVARFGGDEFVILLDGIRDLADPVGCARRVQEKLKQPFLIDQHEIFTSASIGIVIGEASYVEASEILRDADIAMYQAKDRGRDRYEVFDSSMRQPVINRVHLENELRRALENHEFRLHYQPICRLADQTIISFEALLRWEHPERGLTYPGEFLTVAEETGIITAIGDWVLDEACRQMQLWQTEFPRALPLSIGINLSEKQFKHPELLARIGQALETSGLAWQCLNLEITESVIMDNSVLAADILSQLRSSGIEIQMDDFGTGYSSLGVLHQFPMDALKIDRTFISRMTEGEDKLSFVRIILNLAHSLGIAAIAEGVETEKQADMLKALGCAYGQGYYFSKPVGAKKAGQLIAKNSRINPP